MLGEFGGLGLPLEGHTWLEKGNWGYRSFTTPEDLGQGVPRPARRSCRLQIADGAGRGDLHADHRRRDRSERPDDLRPRGDQAVAGGDRGLAGRSTKHRHADDVPTIAKETAADWAYTTTEPAGGWIGRTSTLAVVVRPRRVRTSGYEMGPRRIGWTTSDLWLRLEFELSTARRGSAAPRIHHDEDAEVYLNGVLAATCRVDGRLHVRADQRGLSARIALRSERAGRPRPPGARRTVHRRRPGRCRGEVGGPTAMTILAVGVRGVRGVVAAVGPCSRRLSGRESSDQPCGVSRQRCRRVMRFYGATLGLNEGKTARNTIAFNVGSQQQIIIEPGLTAADDERLSHLAFATPDVRRWPCTLPPAASRFSSRQSVVKKRRFACSIPMVTPFSSADRMAAAPPGARPSAALSESVLHAGLTIRDEQRAHGSTKTCWDSWKSGAQPPRGVT